MLASPRRLQYCEDNHYVALDVYKRYKAATKKALESFATEDLQEAIRLRKEYDDRFIGGDKGSHAEFVSLLETVLELPLNTRKAQFEELIRVFNEKYGYDD